MARLRRLDLPDVTQHIVQRGNNRAPCFFDDHHYRVYLRILLEAAAVAQVSVHAYVLMTNHVHLLVTPRVAGGAAVLMHRIGCRYVPWLNRVLNRCGTLYQGRHKSSLVQSERYLLCCHRYVELNPVRAGMVAKPEDYPWSSYRANALGMHDALLTAHPSFAALGNAPVERQATYRAFVAAGLPDDERDAIRSHLNQERAYGSEDFQKSMEELAGRTTKVRPRGRPRKR